MYGNIDFLYFFGAKWLDVFGLLFRTDKTISRCKMCIMMWFVPLRTFCRYGFGREMAE